MHGSCLLVSDYDTVGHDRSAMSPAQDAGHVAPAADAAAVQLAHRHGA